MSRSYNSNSEEETQAIAVKFAAGLQPNQIVLIEGTLGAGKSYFARSVIRNLCQQPDLNVPSPTFTLCQHYKTSLGDLWHYDLYRLKDPDEIYETGWEDIVNHDILLIEWPERLEHLTPSNAITIKINIGETNQREIIISDES